LCLEVKQLLYDLVFGRLAPCGVESLVALARHL
ncbi:MAG: hypothetical protein ACI9YB_002599, partial [Halioglobus sp.]